MFSFNPLYPLNAPEIKMAGKEFLDHPMEKKINNLRRIPEDSWQKRFERLPQQDQNFFQNGSVALALNSSLIALISNNLFRKILHVTQARYSAVVAMSIVPLTTTAAAYEAVVNHSLRTGKLNCEICAMVRGGLVGAVMGFFYPVILALPLNALLATRYYTAPLPNKDNAVRFWILLSKPIFKKMRFAALIQVSFGAYLASRHYDIYLKAIRMPEPGRDPEEIRE
ncbi:transmembrane protein 126A isoform X1 [Pantherophis guttatus]|uniref:Transmembrane protein 126A isoform X1 n=2 Tax=Pantherophis guttatus TaxID=94885 RepID=A0A6P9B0K1_PANGU|nr:transmembrane protein 126A isoform X1 [Pantherophis guttatus]